MKLCYKLGTVPHTLWEVLMRKSLSRVDQLELFQPPRKIPQWGSLPQESRYKTVRLLARLLREHASAAPGADSAKERGDE